MSNPILVILAAGMGSRYGGLKQIDTVGSNNESIIDFTIYDAIKAGFKKVVLIIRREHEEAFKQCLTDKIKDKIEVVFAYQDLSDVNNIDFDKTREKPWGTTHALLACRNIIDEPFMICNADDFYGANSFKQMYDFLQNEVSDYNYGMVGYVLENTLTENGTVTRGICESVDSHLQSIVEIQKIRKVNSYAEYEEDNQWKKCKPNTLASMNYWGFTPKIFEQCQSIFDEFIAKEILVNPLKCEHVIPTAVATLLANKQCSVKIMSTNDKWFGVTYADDKPSVVNNIQKYKDANIYPFDLWSK